MNLPKMEACGRFIAETTGDYSAPIIIASVEISAGEIRGETAAEIARRCNEYDELKARVAELGAELSEKNRDAERLDELHGLFCSTTDRCPEWRSFIAEWRDTGDIRCAIDHARKNGGAA